MNEHLNNERQECKTGHVKGRVIVGGGRVNKEGEGGGIWLSYFLYMYEYGTLKPVKVILRRGVGKIMKGINQIRVYYTYIWKCCNKTTCIIILY
jgi:hypothetical protein